MRVMRFLGAMGSMAPPLRALAGLCLALVLGSCGGGGEDASPQQPTQERTTVTAIPVGKAVLLVLDRVVTKEDTSRARLKPPSPLPGDTIVLSVVAKVKTHVRAYAFINPANCTLIEDGEINALTSPERGSLDSLTR